MESLGPLFGETPHAIRAEVHDRFGLLPEMWAAPRECAVKMNRVRAVARAFVTLNCVTQAESAGRCLRAAGICGIVRTWTGTVCLKLGTPHQFVVLSCLCHGPPERVPKHMRPLAATARDRCTSGCDGLNHQSRPVSS